MSEPFEASVAISQGVKPIANGGWLTLADDTLSLVDTDGQPVASGPVAEVWAKPRIGTMGSGISVWVGGNKYMISPGSGNRPGGLIAANRAASVVAHGRKFGKAFLAALEAAGGHIGKPPNG